MPLAWLLKAKPLQFLIDASNGRGYSLGTKGNADDILLIDMDIDGYGDVIDQFGGKVVLYPHGAAPNHTWDGVKEPHPKIVKNLVTSEGHKEVMRRYGYPKPVEVIGWYLTELLPFKPMNGNKVLFCPIHPIMNGDFMYEEDTLANIRVFKELLGMDIELAVRYRHSLEMNGLYEEKGVYYYNFGGFDDLDAYDMVVANGTIAYAAIAKGIPTVMHKQETAIRNPGDAANNRVISKSVDKYWDYLKYPYGSDDLEQSMGYVSKYEPTQWKDRFIGKQMDGDRFRETISET